MTDPQDSDQQQPNQEHHNGDSVSSNNELSNLKTKILAAMGMGNTSISAETPIMSLLSFLANGTVEERTAAARKLGKLGQQDAVAPLEQALKTDTSAYVRTAAAAALGELAQYATAEPLLNALQDEDSHVRAAALWSLGNLGERFGNTTRLPLAAAFYDEEEPSHVRASAVRALGKLGEHVDIRWLVDAMNDADWQVREMAGLSRRTRR